METRALDLRLWQLPGLSGLQLKPRPEPLSASIKHQSITRSGLPPPGGQCWPQCRRISHQGEVTESREKQVLGWEVGPQRWQHRNPHHHPPPPSREWTSTTCPGLWVIGSVRFFLGKPWRFVLTESLLKLTRVQTPALPSVGQVTLLKSHDPRHLNFSIYTMESRPISGSRQGLREIHTDSGPQKVLN